MNATAARTDAAGTVVITLDADAAAVLSDFLDSSDASDMALNPGYYGYTDAQGQAISYVLGAIRQPLAKAVSRY